MTTPITDTAPGRYSAWSIPRQNPHPVSHSLSFAPSATTNKPEAKILPFVSGSHSNSLLVAPAAADTPVTKLLPVTGGQFTRSALPVGSNGSPSTPSPEAGGAKMDGPSHPDRAAPAVIMHANSGRAVAIPQVQP